MPGDRFWTGNADAEMRRLRQAGYTLPNSAPMARLEAKRVGDTVRSGSLTDNTNRMMSADFRRRRASGLRTGANVQMAMPKFRTPLGSLEDKNVPFNIEDRKELAECRRWARAFYVTHDLVPLLIDIYARFPLVGLEFKSTDPLIEKFYTQMFMEDLDYENFLPDSLGREYYVAGEVTSLAHFNESLGIWSSEEVLNPDFVRVGKGLFVEEERVQLMVKDLVDGLRDGPAGVGPDEETRSEREERLYEYRMLVQNYPEIIRAAQQEDGLDISPAKWSRIVNKSAPWHDYVTPPLLRSFRTLMMEESLNAAQDAVADRLYAPMIVATLGLENMGDGLPWIPQQSDLDDLRDDMQNAFMADFKLICHHMGLNVENVFGRESVPRFDQDYERIDLKLMQAWGIGSALIMGGTGAGGTYASSALNREVCELLMKSYQKKVIRHIVKRMEVIAEAQQHYAYEKKGGYRRPLYKEVVQFNEETGEEEIVRVPQLLIPKVEFASLNLRDESQERQFMMMLKQAGVPISDKSLAINIPIDFEQELPRGADETVDKLVAQAEAMGKAQSIIDHKELPYPAELAMYLQQTLQLRTLLAQTKMIEGQEEMQETQIKQQGAAGAMGVIPGTPPAPPPEEDEGGEGGEEGAAPMPPPMPLPIGPPPVGPGGPMPPAGMPMPPQMADQGPMQMAAAKRTPFQVNAPSAQGPGILPPDMEFAGENEFDTKKSTDPYADIIEPARNRTRPEISDDMRGDATTPRAATRVGRSGIRKKAEFEKDPSSWGHRKRVSESAVEKAVRRREAQANPPNVEELVHDPKFYAITGIDGYRAQIQGDFPHILAGSDDDSTKESIRILEDALLKYEQQTGVRPIW
jgi:hypothetical protein